VLAAAALGETDFLVYMENQADLRGADAISGKEAKGSIVYNQLRAAQESQSTLTTVLDGLGVSYQPFWIVNAVSTRGNLAVVQAAASLDAVAYVYPNTESTFELPAATQAATLQHAPEAVEWNIAQPQQPWQTASGILLKPPLHRVAMHLHQPCRRAAVGRPSAG
jgi:hypothetical protein